MGGHVPAGTAQMLADAMKSPWRPIATAPVETPIHLWGRGGISGAVGAPYATVGELDNGRGYAIDYRGGGCDCITPRTMWEPELWAPFPGTPR